jgi:hypothetical protein
MYAWTIVQHSGYAFGGKPEFSQGLETMGIDTPAVMNRVRQAGGLVFTDYDEAEDYAQEQMYPPDVQGLIPRALGGFSHQHVNGLAIYIPKEQ